LILEIVWNLFPYFSKKYRIGNLNSNLFGNSKKTSRYFKPNYAKITKNQRNTKMSTKIIENPTNIYEMFGETKESMKEISLKEKPTDEEVRLLNMFMIAYGINNNDPRSYASMLVLINLLYDENITDLISVMKRINEESDEKVFTIQKMITAIVNGKMDKKEEE
jgi:hypothetical protein